MGQVFLQAVKESAEDATEAIHKLSALHDRNYAAIKQMGRAAQTAENCFPIWSKTLLLILGRQQMNWDSLLAQYPQQWAGL